MMNELTTCLYCGVQPTRLAVSLLLLAESTRLTAEAQS